MQRYRYMNSSYTYNDIMQSNEASNNDRLANFKSVDTSIDIDGIGAEYWQHAHVQHVERAQIDHRALGRRVNWDANNIVEQRA